MKCTQMRSILLKIVTFKLLTPIFKNYNFLTTISRIFKLLQFVDDTRLYLWENFYQIPAFSDFFFQCSENWFYKTLASTSKESFKQVMR